MTTTTKTIFRIDKVEVVTRQCTWCRGAKTPGKPCTNCRDTGACTHEKITKTDLITALDELGLIHRTTNEK